MHKEKQCPRGSVYIFAFRRALQLGQSAHRSRPRPSPGSQPGAKEGIPSLCPSGWFDKTSTGVLGWPQKVKGTTTYLFCWPKQFFGGWFERSRPQKVAKVWEPWKRVFGSFYVLLFLYTYCCSLLVLRLALASFSFAWLRLSFLARHLALGNP